MVAHYDIDERAARETGELRYPSRVIIAFIEVEPSLRAPTILWTPFGDGEALCAVPAVTGRLLRFDGEMLHAVPRPLCQHFVPAAEEDAVAASRSYRRRVLIINCWAERAPDDDEPDVGPSAACADVATAGYAHDLAELRCHPFAEWCRTPIERCPTSRPTDVAAGVTTLSTSMFGTTWPLVTTVDAPALAVMTMLESAHAPSWLPVRSAAPAEGTAPGRKRARDVETETGPGTG